MARGVVYNRTPYVSTSSRSVLLGAAGWENPTVQVYALTSERVPGETLDLFLSRELPRSSWRRSLRTSPNGWTFSVWY
jgi:hypothetical protein